MADAGTLKALNLKKIREVLRTGCPISKTALTDKTGLSFPTVSKLVDELVMTHELRIVGSQVSSGGRSGRIYQYNQDFCSAVVMILDGQTIDWFILDSLGMTKNQGVLQLEGDLLETLILLLQTSHHRDPSLCCFVVGIAASTNGETVQESFVYPQLKGVNLLKELEQASGLKGAVGNDMGYAAEGSWQRLRMNDKTSLVSFYLGQCGFGSSFVYRGQALRGAHHLAGEIELLPWIHDAKLNADLQPDTIPEAVLQCMAAYAVIADPDFIQLYSHPFFIKHFDEIEAVIKQSCAEALAPKLLLSDSFRVDYELGLSRHAQTLMAQLTD